jgi:3-oxoacyl-[acyl-carrier protein] reductase
MFAGRVALVTGGGSGIGRAVALELARAGAHVAVTGRRVPPLEETAGMIETAGGKALAVAGDVSCPQDVERVIGRVISTWGQLQIAVNAAGVAHEGSLAETTPEDFDRVISINLRGVYLVCRAAAAHLAATGNGAIVNIASILGMRGTRGTLVYSISKAGVISLTRCIAGELGPAVRANCICPDGVRTAMLEDMLNAMSPEAYSRLMTQYPLRRLGEPEDIAHAVAFLASDAASWISGQVLVIDGGRHR